MKFIEAVVTGPMAAGAVKAGSVATGAVETGAVGAGAVGAGAVGAGPEFEMVLGALRFLEFLVFLDVGFLGRCWWTGPFEWNGWVRVIRRSGFSCKGK